MIFKKYFIRNNPYPEAFCDTRKKIDTARTGFGSGWAARKSEKQKNSSSSRAGLALGGRNFELDRC
jgi:hypothetical protein